MRRRRHRRPHGLALGLVVTALTGRPGVTRAADVTLAPLITRGDSGLVVDEGALEHVASQFAFGARPATLGPVHTGGPLGMRWGYRYASTPTASRAAGPAAAASGVSGDHLGVSQCFVGKGLPGAVALELALSWLHDVDAHGVAASVEWAFIEGVDAAPEVGGRVFGGALLGHPDLSVASAGLDLVLSKAFALGGAVRVTPFGGYRFSVAHSVSGTIPVVLAGDVTATPAVMPSTTAVAHHATVGLEVSWGPVRAAVEAQYDAETVGWSLSLAVAP